jgi:hypothetical protein
VYLAANTVLAQTFRSTEKNLPWHPIVGVSSFDCPQKTYQSIQIWENSGFS